jgi:hypothetical protein
MRLTEQLFLYSVNMFGDWEYVVLTFTEHEEQQATPDEDSDYIGEVCLK